MTKNQISGYIDTPIDLESSLCGGQSFRWMIKNKGFRGVKKIEGFVGIVTTMMI